MNIYTLQTPKACPLIEIFCIFMQKIHKCNRLLASEGGAAIGVVAGDRLPAEAAFPGLFEKGKI
jgi:hypothetical protein